MKRITAVILAAGASTRFGQPKQLLDWGGKPFLAHIADVALEAELAPVIVVLGCQAKAASAALGTRPVQAVMNWRWEEGLSTSVRAGLAALPPETRTETMTSSMNNGVLVVRFRRRLRRQTA